MCSVQIHVLSLKFSDVTRKILYLKIPYSWSGYDQLHILLMRTGGVTGGGGSDVDSDQDPVHTNVRTTLTCHVIS